MMKLKTNRSIVRFYGAAFVAFAFPLLGGAFGQEVGASDAGRQVDRVRFGHNNVESFSYHSGALVGGVASDTYSLSQASDSISWDFTAQRSGAHVLSVWCNIFSDRRLATPMFQRADATWVALPQMPYREPWPEYIRRYYLIDLSAGVTRFRLQFSGVQYNAFYAVGADLHEQANSLPDTDAPLIVDYIDADGVFQASFQYYAYAVQYLCLFLDPLKRLKDTNLYHHNRWRRSRRAHHRY